MNEMHLRQTGFAYSTCGHFHESKNLKKQEIAGISIKTNNIKLVFNMTWYVEILKF